MHLCAALPNACYQESVRAHIQTAYRELIDVEVVIKDGHVELPRRPDLGVAINPDFFKNGREGYRITK